jgi:hypothetical protein
VSKPTLQQETPASSLRSVDVVENPAFPQLVHHRPAPRVRPQLANREVRDGEPRPSDLRLRPRPAGLTEAQLLHVERRPAVCPASGAPTYTPSSASSTPMRAATRPPAPAPPVRPAVVREPSRLVPVFRPRSTGRTSDSGCSAIRWWNSTPGGLGAVGRRQFASPATSYGRPAWSGSPPVSTSTSCLATWADAWKERTPRLP